MAAIVHPALADATVFPVALDKNPKLASGIKSWRNYPKALPKSATGYGVDCSASGYLVLDVDRNHKSDGGQLVDGVEQWKAILEEQGATQPKTLTVATTSGGYHYYFKAPEGTWLKTGSGDLASAIDTRGTGGYVVGPGSVAWPKVPVLDDNGAPVLDEEGNPTLKLDKSRKVAYEVIDDAPVAEIPEWLVELLRSKKLLKTAEDKAREEEEAEAERQRRMEEYGRRQAERKANPELYPEAKLSEKQRNSVEAMLTEMASLGSGQNRHSKIFSISRSIGKVVGPDFEHDFLPEVIQAAIASGHREGCKPGCAQRQAEAGFFSGIEQHEIFTPSLTFSGSRKQRVALDEEKNEEYAVYEVPYLTSDFFTDIGVARGFADAQGHRYMAIREWREKTRSAFDQSRGTWGEINGEEVSTAIQVWITDEIFPELLRQSEERLAKVGEGSGTDGDEYKEQQKTEGRLIARADRYRGKASASSAAQTFFGGNTRTADIFDADPDLLLTPSGVVDLTTGELRAARPEDYFTKRAGVAYEPGARSELWDEILTAFEPSTLEYLQVIVGQGLTGYQPSDPSVYFFVGGGANGKSTFLDTVVDMLGDYSETLDSDMLSGNDSFSRSGFKGVRLNLFEETGEGQHLDDKAVKKITGTDKMRGAQKFKDEETFKVITTNFITTNELPRITALDEGTWRRLKVFSMPNKYVRPENYDQSTAPATTRLRNPALNKANQNPEIMRAAMAWAVEGAIKWFAANKQEPAVPQAMIDAQKEWRYQQDKIGYWWTDYIVNAEERFVLLSDLYETFKMSMKESGREPGSKQKFTAALESHALFLEAKAEYKQRVKVPRVDGKLALLHSTTTGPSNSHPLADPPGNLSSAEDAAKARFWVKGIRFRTAADGDEDDQLELADDLDELTDLTVDDLDLEEAFADFDA